MEGSGTARAPLVSRGTFIVRPESQEEVDQWGVGVHPLMRHCPLTKLNPCHVLRPSGSAYGFWGTGPCPQTDEEIRLAFEKRAEKPGARKVRLSTVDEARTGAPPARASYRGWPVHQSQSDPSHQCACSWVCTVGSDAIPTTTHPRSLLAYQPSHTRCWTHVGDCRPPRLGPSSCASWPPTAWSSSPARQGASPWVGLGGG